METRGGVRLPVFRFAMRQLASELTTLYLTSKLRPKDEV